jgi:predicted DCC family thiol-disulfide oxidoreductase YuxK
VNPSLYYDGTCPLCSKEISMLKRLSNDGIDFVDIHQVNDAELPSKELLLKRLHLRKSNGEWLVGLDANVYAWSLTPYGILFKILRIWPIRSIADLIYIRWADQRFNKRYECNKCNV